MPHLLAHLSGRLYGVPLLIHQPKLDLILSVLGSRTQTLPLPDWVQPDRTVLQPPPGIAVIEVHGSLVRRTAGLDPVSGMLSYDSISQQLDAALASADVQGILLSIDSAGGEAGGVFDLADRIFAARTQKPIWAIADDMAFSAAYAIASSAERVWVTRTGGVGSVGVIALHVDQSARDAMDGLVVTPVYSGAKKNDLSPHQPLADRARADLQTEVDRLYGMFLATVSRNRKLDPERVRATEAGLLFANDALAQGFADGIGNPQEVLSQFSSYLAGRNATAQNTIFATTPKEMKMSADPGLGPQLNQTIQSGSTSLSLTTLAAVEIAQLCSLAGRTDRIVGFLESGAKPDQVRHALLEIKASASPEIQSRLDLQSATPAQSASPNPLMVAAQRLSQRQQSLKKEQ